MLMSALIVLSSVSSPMTVTTTPAAAVSQPATHSVCPVCGKSIAPGQGTKIAVRGHEYAVDDKECGEELMSNPDKFLEPDGTPKNSKK